MNSIILNIALKDWLITAQCSIWAKVNLCFGCIGSWAWQLSNLLHNAHQGTSCPPGNSYRRGILINESYCTEFVLSMACYWPGLQVLTEQNWQFECFWSQTASLPESGHASHPGGPHWPWSHSLLTHTRLITGLFTFRGLTWDSVTRGQYSSQHIIIQQDVHSAFRLGNGFEIKIQVSRPIGRYIG